MASNVRTCLGCMQSFAAKSLPSSSQLRFISSTSILERLKRDFRIKPEPKKKKWVPPTIRKDLIFMYDAAGRRAFPFHKFELAMELLRACAVKDENVGLFFRLNLNGNNLHSSSIRGNMILPKQFRERKLLVLAENEQAQDARESGADIVGGREILPEVEAEEYEFDYCLSSLEFLPHLQSLSNVLRFRMPSQHFGTATNNLAFAVKEFKRGHKYKCDGAGGVSIDFARLSFTDEEIRENLEAVVKVIESHAPEGVQSESFVKKLYITSCYGPGLLLQKWDFLQNQKKTVPKRRKTVQYMRM